MKRMNTMMVSVKSKRESAWQPESKFIDNIMPDEPVRETIQLYLREAGKVDLLSAQGERRLGMRMEAGDHLSELEQDWSSRFESELSPAKKVMEIFRNLGNNETALVAMERQIGITPDGSVVRRLKNPELHRVIDGPLSTELIACVSNATGMTPDQAKAGIIAFSNNSRVLPWNLVHVIDNDFGSLHDFTENLEGPSVYNSLLAYSPKIERHFSDIHRRAKAARDHLIKANLRLVISVAGKRINRKGISA